MGCGLISTYHDNLRRHILNWRIMLRHIWGIITWRIWGILHWRILNDLWRGKFRASHVIPYGSVFVDSRQSDRLIFLRNGAFVCLRDLSGKIPPLALRECFGMLLGYAHHESGHDDPVRRAEVPVEAAGRRLHQPLELFVREVRVTSLELVWKSRICALYSSRMKGREQMGVNSNLNTVRNYWKKVHYDFCGYSVKIYKLHR